MLKYIVLMLCVSCITSTEKGKLPVPEQVTDHVIIDTNYYFYPVARYVDEERGIVCYINYQAISCVKE